MSNSQNKKNEQQNNLCTTLTGQWKKGELPFGCYYIKDINDETFADHYTNNGFRNGFEDFFDDEIEEVLAPVPSYEEWKELKLHDEKATIKLGETIIENDKLKELLKECKHIMNIEKDFASCHFEKHKLGELLTKIDEVLK